MLPCSELRHIAQQTSTGWESVIFSGPITDAVIYSRQPTTTLDPLPVAEVGAVMGWCAPTTNNLDAPAHFPTTQAQAQAQPPAPRAPLPRAGEVIDLAVALACFAGLAYAVRWVSLRLAPPPPPPWSEPETLAGTARDSPAGTVRDDSDQGHETHLGTLAGTDIWEPFDLTGVSLGDFKSDLCDAIENNGKGFEPMEVMDRKTQPAIIAAIHRFCQEYGTTRPEFCLWQVFKLTRKGGNSNYAHRCKIALTFIAEQFETFEPQDLF